MRRFLIACALLLWGGIAGAQSSDFIRYYPPAGLATLTGTSTAMTSTVPLILPVGSDAAPSFGFAGATNYGPRYAGSTIFWVIGGAVVQAFTGSNIQVRSDAGAIYFGAATDVMLGRGAANVLYQNIAGSPQFLRTGGGYGGYNEIGLSTEEITLSTVAVTTDSTANLLPADAVILSVSTRVTDAITTCVNFSVGEATTAARFISASTGVGLGSTAKGILQWNPANADAAGPVQTADAKIRITCNANAGAGKIRVQVAFIRPAAPSS
jgi:hypothetical protein